MNTFYKICLLLVVCMLSQFSVLKAQERVPFTLRYEFPDSDPKNGDFVMTGNTNLTLLNYSPTAFNGNADMIYVDVDLDPTTLNSSSALLQLKLENGALPACTEIVWAGLYWSGRCDTDGNTSPITFDVTKNGVTKTFDKREIKLKGPSAFTYTTFTADDSDIYYPVSSSNAFRTGFMYSAFVDVTDYVKAQGEGMYTAADIALKEATAFNNDGTGLYGGWGLVVAYKNHKMKARDVKIYDGHYYTYPSGGVDVHFDLNISGLNIIPQGPVNVKLGMMSGEGDISTGGTSRDYFQIKKNSDGSFMNLSHTLNSPNNFFASSINVFEPPITGSRNPELVNNTGMDIAMFTIPNDNNDVVANSQNDITFRYGTSGDTYIIYMIGMSVDTYTPQPEAILSVESIDGIPPIGLPPYTVTPGQIIQYKVEFVNPSNENIEETYLKIPIPFATTYVPNSAVGTLDTSVITPYIAPTFNSTLGTNGSVEWNVGTLPFDISDPNKIFATLLYSVKVTDDCRLLKSPLCNVFVETIGTLTGKGELSQQDVTFNGMNGVNTIIGREITSCGVTNIRGSLVTNIDSDAYVAANCTSTPSIFTYESCQDSPIPFSTIVSDFPVGTKFYDIFPLTSSSTELTASNDFPTTLGELNYYAVQPGNPNCAIPLKITYNEGPDATISGMVECLDSSLPFVTFEASGGQAPYSFDYTLNGNPLNVSTTGTNSSITVSVPTNTAGTYSYQLTKVTDSKGCDKVYSLNADVVINSHPTVTNATVPICDDDFDGTFIYTLSDANNQLVSDVTLYDFHYFNSMIDAQNSTNEISPITDFAINSVPKDIYVVVEDKVTHCTSIAVITFTQNSLQTVQNVTLDAECADGVLSDSGFATFDLTAKNDDINANGTTYTFYTNENDAKLGGSSGQITNPTTFENTTADAQTVWVRIEETGFCDAIASVDLLVNELPYSTTLVDRFICYNDVITLDAGSGFLSYQWYFNDVELVGETSQTLGNVNQAGEYAVLLTGMNLCTYKQIVKVQRGNIPYIVDIKYGNSTVEFFGAGGIPPYEYSINGGTFSFNSYYELEPGLYNVAIRSQTCESEPIPVPVVGWATVFTPNGDGKNDTWRIKGLEFTSEPKVYIFDRYGKSLGELTNLQNYIWDGKYQGRPLPTTSYWFVMEFRNSFLNKSYLFNGYIMVKDRNDGSNIEFNRVQ